VENDSLVTGYRQTNGWGRTRTLYFALQFSLNGQKLTRPFLPHEDIMNGGELIFVLAAKP
jgi:putative alpha-1,2-mannosidase